MRKYSKYAKIWNYNMGIILKGLTRAIQFTKFYVRSQKLWTKTVKKLVFSREKKFFFLLVKNSFSREKIFFSWKNFFLAKQFFFSRSNIEKRHMHEICAKKGKICAKKGKICANKVKYALKRTEICKNMKFRAKYAKYALTNRAHSSRNDVNRKTTSHIPVFIHRSKICVFI